MGGYGSGRDGWRGKVETYQVLDMNELRSGHAQRQQDQAAPRRRRTSGSGTVP
jgi:hypothetical protein